MALARQKAAPGARERERERGGADRSGDRTIIFVTNMPYYGGAFVTLHIHIHMAHGVPHEYRADIDMSER